MKGELNQSLECRMTFQRFFVYDIFAHIHYILSIVYPDNAMVQLIYIYIIYCLSLLFLKKRLENLQVGKLYVPLQLRPE